jgi:hypothetical protein
VKPVYITGEWNQTARARAIPDAFWNPGGDGVKPGWYLPGTADAHSARVALRLFPALIENDELVDHAAVQDIRPVDLASKRWVSRPMSDDPWQRVLAACADL